MKSIEEIFIEEKGHFTVFVVDQDFALVQGKDFFKSYINTEHFINSKGKIKKCLRKTLETVEKGIEPISSLISFITPILGGASITTLSMETFLSVICKLMTVHEHKAAGPDIIDPLIIQEGKITIRDLIKTVNLYKDSILRPTIILILQDNNFDRAISYLKKCPDGTYIKYVNLNSQFKTIRVVNSGVENIDEFINAFSDQCFNTCSNTKRDILLPEEYNENNLVSIYAPQFFRIRSNLLFDKKTDTRNELNEIIAQLESFNCLCGTDSTLRNCFLCVALLFRVFSYDRGANDIKTALSLAQDLNNDILLAQVYRYADFFNNINQTCKEDMLKKGYDIFHNNTMEDHAIYCKNNLLVNQFSTDSVNELDFKEMQEEAIGGVPGMVGLAHIYNNVGISFLYNGLPIKAIDYFEKGLDYAQNEGRLVQNIALRINKSIAKNYMFELTEEKELRTLLRQIMDTIQFSLPFIASRYVMNIVSLAFSQNEKLGTEFMSYNDLISMINQSLLSAPLGSEQLILQIKYLSETYSSFPGDKFILANRTNTTVTGRRRAFIVKYGLNPFHFKTWL